MILSEWTRLQGIHPQAVYRWFRDDRSPIPAALMNARTVLIAPDAVLTPASRAAAA